MNVIVFVIEPPLGEGTPVSKIGDPCIIIVDERRDWHGPGPEGNRDLPHLVKAGGLVFKWTPRSEESHLYLASLSFLEPGAKAGAVHMSARDELVAVRPDERPGPPRVWRLIEVVFHFIWLKPFRHLRRVVPGNHQVHTERRNEAGGRLTTPCGKAEDGFCLVNLPCPVVRVLAISSGVICPIGGLEAG